MHNPTQYLNSRSIQSMIKNFLIRFQSFSLNWHTLQRHQNVQRDFNQQFCSLGPTTTQQQVHNRTPAGFYQMQQQQFNLLPKLKFELIKFL